MSMLLFAMGTLMAQRTLTGTVTDDSGQTLIGATVQAKGTTVGTVTDIDGKYSIDVPDGTTTLVFSYTGFSTQEVEIGASNVIDVTLDEGLELSEVVVTGLGIKKEKKALGYGVSTISSSDIELKTESDIARILRGKATGVDITQTSGLAGSGTNVIIRGYSSITGNNQPLFVVDGVPFNTDTNSDRSARQGGSTASSRFLDLDPNSIAEVSILKGLSATVLYGEAGRNGVVLITTKNGSGTSSQKGFEVNVSQQVSFTQIANLPDYQNTYGNGFSGNFGWFFSNWGPSFDTRGSNGIDENGQVKHPYDQARYNDDFPEFIGARYDYKPYQSVEQFFDNKGFVSNTSLSISKNLGDNSTISASYSYLSDEGFIPRRADGSKTNNISKHNFGLGATTKLDNGLNIRATFNYIDLDRSSPTNAFSFGSGPGRNSSLFGEIFFTPRSVDIFGLPYQSPKDGSMAYYRQGSAIQHPLWTLNNTGEEENVRRFFSTMEANYELTPWLTAMYRIGIDQYTQQNRRHVNKGGSQIPDGLLNTSERFNRITAQLFNLLYNTKLNEDFDLDGLVGVNLRRVARNRTFATSTQQFVFGLNNHGNFIEHNIASDRQEENNIGAFATATLGYKSFLYLGIQARNDWTSTLEKENRSVFYPSANISFVPTDAFESLQNNSVLNYLKLRVGYGTSAGYPDPYQTRNTLFTATNQYVAQNGNVFNINSNRDNLGIARLGNPNLREERHTELEFGVEGRFLSNRIGLDLSAYNRQSKDLIIDLRLDPSTGYTRTTVNAAALENKGVELGLNFIPLKGDFTWDINLNFTKNINKVLKIADGVDQVVISGFSNLGNFAIPGEAYGIIQGIPFERLNGELLTSADGNYVPGTDIAPIGNPNPNYTANWINTFSYKGLSLNFHFSYIDGGDIYSITNASMLARGNTIDTDFDRFLPVILPGVKADGTPNDVQTYIGDVSFRSYFFADEGAVFDGTVIRLREIGLSYVLPKGILENSPFGSASITISGENLWYNAPNFPVGVNFDPEVLSLGVGNGRGFDFFTGPTAKKYGVALNVTF